MTTKFNPLAKKGFDKIGDTAGLVSDTAYGASWDGVTTIAPSKNAVYDKIQTLAGGHDAVTLDANADTLLSLSTQELGLDTQVANTIFAGPASGADAVPTFRALVADDIPDLSGTYLTAETDPDFNAWLLATPPLYPGGWYDAVQNTIGLSGFNNDAGFITSFDDEKVKYDAGDPTAGYVADKIIAGTGISVAEGTGANENKLVVTSDITQYTDSDAIAAIQGDASWNASDWDTAYGWGNHASAGYYVGDGSAFDVAGAGASAVSGHELTYDHTLIATALQSETDPVFTAWDKSTGISITKSQISDLVLAQSEAGASNNFLTAYNSTTGAFSKAQPTWADIDKTTSDIADITTKSHTSLTDIGTLTHTTIDSYLDQAVKVASSPKFASVEITDAGRVGFAGNKAHIQFDDEAVDTISMMYANIGVGTTTPAPFVAGSTCLDFTSTNNMEMIFDHTDAGVGSVLGDLNFARADTLLAQIRGAIDGAKDAAYLSFSTQPTGGAVTERMRITSKGNVTIGSAALATNATDGFLYIPSCAGKPTGTPAAYSGRVPLVFDTTNNKLYVYDGSWIDVT